MATLKKKKNAAAKKLQVNKNIKLLLLCFNYVVCLCQVIHTSAALQSDIYDNLAIETDNLDVSYC